MGILVLVLGTSGLAAAIPLIGDETRIEVTGDLGGIALAPVGAAFFNALGELVLPVTGGDLTIPLLEGTIEHADAVVELSAGDDVITLSDLVFDTTNLEVSGVLSAVIDGGPVFDGAVSLFFLRACLFSTGTDACIDGDGSTLLNGFGMNTSDTLAGFLTDAFGPGYAAGDAFGVALLDVRFGAPAPGILALLLAPALLFVRARRS